MQEVCVCVCSEAEERRWPYIDDMRGGRERGKERDVVMAVGTVFEWTW